METVTVGMALRNFSGLTGVGRCVLELARRLPALGFPVHVAAHRLPERPAEGASFERVPMLPFSSRLRAASFDWMARRRLRARGVRLVHGHGDLARQDVLSVHNCDAAAARWVPDGRVPSAGSRCIRGRQFSEDGCRVMVVNSEMVRRDVAEFCGVRPERIRRAYLGVDLERFRPARRAAARAALLRETGWPAETAVVLAVLSGDPAKRNFGLTAAAVELLSKRRPAALCVAGNVPWQKEPAARRLKDIGRFFHSPAAAGVEDFFAAADALALPAHYEEFGMPVLEALASGCPAVAGRRVGAAELLTPGADGFLVEDLKDPGELAEKLGKAADLKDASAACRRTAEAHSWDKYAQEMAGIYRELL